MRMKGKMTLASTWVSDNDGGYESNDDNWAIGSDFEDEALIVKMASHIVRK